MKTETGKVYIRCKECGKVIEVSIEQDVEEDEKDEGVFIERAGKLDRKGIRAVCGTDEEYDKYVKEMDDNQK